MAFQSGLTAIPNGVSTLTVTFVEPFSTTPEVVIPVVQNTDGMTQIMVASVKAVSTTAFSVELSALTDSADYSLAWFAGDPATIFEVMSQGLRITDLPDISSTPDDTDRIPLLRWSSPIRTNLISWQAIRQHFPNIKSIPGSAHAAGAAGDIALPTALSAFVFFHNGVRWGRIPVDQDPSWSSQSVLTSFREGLVSLTSAATVHSVAFNPELANTVPDVDVLVQVQILNVTDNPVSVLHGIVTARSYQGFTFVTNAPVPSANYKLSYSARVSTN